MARFSTNPYAGGVASAEHVSIESDLWEVRAKPNLLHPLASYELSRGGRGVTKRVSILADQYAAVETQGTRSKTNVHTVDLRFVDPRPIAVRKVPWRLLFVAIGVTLLMVVSIALYVKLPRIAHEMGGVLTPVGLATLTIACYALCYFLTTESWLFVSVHGRARLIVIAGRLGTIRRAHACVAELAAHIRLTRKQLKQTRQAYLSNEMREHSRLFEQGVLSDKQYSDAKCRILSAHK